jgi:hypothetical protein
VRAASHRTPLPSDGSARHPPARQARAPATAQAALMAGVPVEAPKRIALGLRGQTVRRLRANTGPLACTGRETETAGAAGSWVDIASPRRRRSTSARRRVRPAACRAACPWSRGRNSTWGS